MWTSLKWFALCLLVREMRCFFSCWYRQIVVYLLFALLFALCINKEDSFPRSVCCEQKLSIYLCMYIFTCILGRKEKLF